MKYDLSFLYDARLSKAPPVVDSIFSKGWQEEIVGGTGDVDATLVPSRYPKFDLWP